MTTRPNRSQTNLILSGSIALVQLFDILIHAATNQLEPLRVATNLVVLLWVGLAVSRKLQRWRWETAVSITTITLYLGGNLLFLALAGITNPAQGGALRVTLFVLVGLTLLLSAWLALRQSSQNML